MTRRMEVTLIIVLAVALGAVALLAWGQYAGLFKIFGDQPLVPSSGGRIPVNSSKTRSESSSETLVSVSFDSDRLLDRAATTADWNYEAGEARLKPGQAEGLIQSLKLSDKTSEQVRTTLTVEEARPVGAQIYYAVSANGGKTWVSVVPGQTETFLSPAGDWRVRILLSRGQASSSPSVQSIALSFE